jgi:hypothetical protein
MTKIGTTIVGVSVALLVGCGRPPLRIEPSEDGVQVDVQTLGEYQTTVNRIRLTCDGRPTWEVVANRESPQIHRFPLRTGANPSYPGDVSEPEYRAVLPDRCRAVQIPRGARCILEVWGRQSALSRAEKTIDFPK